MTEKICQFSRDARKYKLVNTVTSGFIIRLWEKWPKCLSETNSCALS